MKSRTHSYIENLLTTNNYAVERAMVAIYNRQTESEKYTESTKENNGMGFSAFHARTGSYYAKWVISGRKLTGEHLVKARRMAMHYVGQLALIADENRGGRRMSDTIPCPPPMGC